MYDAFVRLIDKPFVGLESFKPRGAFLCGTIFGPYLEVFICVVGSFDVLYFKIVWLIIRSSRS